MINWEELKTTLNDTEYKVLYMFLVEKMSIRNITQAVGLGRTKVGNILDACLEIDEELEKEITLRKLNLRTHKNVETIEEIDLTPLTDEQIKKAYKEIMQGGKTLTTVSTEIGKQRDTVKKAIIDWLENDNGAIKEFRQQLKNNQNGLGKTKYFDESSNDDKKKMIFDRLNARTVALGRKPYSESMLEKKYNRLREYFEKRNSRMPSDKDKISEDDLLAMLYEHPTMLPLSISDKIRPIIGKLDEKYLGEANTTRVLKEYPGIVSTTLIRIRLQIKILKDTDTLALAMKKPRTFRTSPELMYAEIKKWKEQGSKKYTPFMRRSRLEETYKKTPEELMEEYDILDEYGDDEYFDGR